MSFRTLAMSSTRWLFNSKTWQPSQSDWMTAARYIQQEEKERIGKFVFKRDAKSSMIGRLMLRRLIRNATKLSCTEIKLARTDKGKPFLQNDLPSFCPNLSFNVSHQGEYVVLAAETNCDVGIDIMNCETPRANSVADFFHTMRRQFTDEEWRTIKSHRQEQDQLRTFYRLWCLKESYVKALGVGIGFEVARLNFNLSSALPASTDTVCSTLLKVDGKDMLDWTFEECCHDNHCIAVAVHKKKDPQTQGENDKTFTVLTFEELLSDLSPLSEPDGCYGAKFIQKDEDPFTQNHKSTS